MDRITGDALPLFRNICAFQTGYNCRKFRVNNSFLYDKKTPWLSLGESTSIYFSIEGSNPLRPTENDKAIYSLSLPFDYLYIIDMCFV